MPFTTKTLNLQLITVTDKFNLHPWDSAPPSQTLNNSFASCGILHPPIVQEIKNSNYLLLSGKKRIYYATKNNLATLPCHVLPATAAANDILHLIYTEQSLHRQLSIAEKAQFLSLFLANSNATSPDPEWLQRYELPVKPQQYSQLLMILREPVDFLQAAHSGFLNDKIVLELLGLETTADRLAMLSLFRCLEMGANKQRKFLMMLKDLALSNKKSIAGYVNSSVVQDIVQNEQLNIPQRIQHLGTALQEASSPGFSAAQRLFNEQIRNVDLPQRCQITPSTSFEKDELTLTIPFANITELKSKLTLIKKISE